MLAIYVGSGTDVSIIKILKCIEIEKYYFIDCQPFSEFGLRNYLENGVNLFSRKNFLNYLEEDCKKNNLELHSISYNSDIKYIAQDDNYIITYLLNTALPYHFNRIWKNIPSNFTHLIVKGHHPHYKICEHILHKIIFIGFYGTYYKTEPYDITDDPNSIIVKLNTVPEYSKEKFKLFLYFDSNNVKKEFKTWELYSLCAGS